MLFVSLLSLAGSVKFHFVIIPLFFHSHVSKYCFSKSSLLLSCKDLLLHWWCTLPAVPLTEQFHPFFFIFWAFQKKNVSSLNSTAFSGWCQGKGEGDSWQKTVQATISRLLLWAWSLSTPDLSHSLCSAIPCSCSPWQFRMGKQRQSSQCCVHQHPRRAEIIPPMQGGTAWAQSILVALVMQNELQMFSRAAMGGSSWFMGCHGFPTLPSPVGTVGRGFFPSSGLEVGGLSPIQVT